MTTPIEEKPTLCWFATKGAGTNEALRMATLLAGHPQAVELPFDKARKKESLRALWRRVGEKRPRLLVMEGTGLAGGLVCLAARLLYGTRYVVSSGDAVGPFLAAHHRFIGPLAHLYERLLCRFSAGFVGWTPYLTGRALTFGAPRAMTAPGWPIGGAPGSASDRAALRRRWGVPDEALVIGIAGSLEWNERIQWCYGADLVQAVRRSTRPDLAAIVIGGGSGLQKLRDLAGPELGRRVFLPGPVPLEEVMPALTALDLASLPQSVDGVGMFRYTTKLPEYAGAGLPVVTNTIPAAYDLGEGWMWTLPGANPWSERYLAALARFLTTVTREDIRQRRERIPALEGLFDREAQVARMTRFIGDLLEETR